MTLNPEQLDEFLGTYSTHELRILMKDVAALQAKPLKYEAHPAQERFHRSKAKIKLACAGNRCLRGDQKIVTMRGLVCVRDIEEGEMVLSYDQESNRYRWNRSSASFVKGYDRLVRVVHEAGEFVCHGRHRIFSDRGKYEWVDDLKVGDGLRSPSGVFLSHGATMMGFCLRVLHEGVVSLKRRVLSFLGDCRACSYLYGQRLLFSGGVVEGCAQRCIDAGAFALLSCHQRVLPFDQMGGQRSWRNHRDRFGILSRSLDETGLSSDLFSSVLEGPSVCGWLQRILACIRSSQKSLLKRVKEKIVLQFDRQSFGFLSSVFPYRLSSPISRIKSIERLDKVEAYYDLTVSRDHNYVTEDLTIHHNSGKSEAGTQELYWRLTGTHPYLKTRVPITAWAGAPSFKQAYKILWKKLKNKIEPRLITRIKKNSEGYIDHVEFANGSTLDFKTYKQDPMDWESEDVDYALLDEPPPRELFIALMRGLVDRDGDVAITATPLKEPWIFNELWEPGMKGKRPEISCHQWSSYDNPHTNHEALRRFEATLTPEEREVRILGNFKKLIGRVLNHFDYDGLSIVKAFQWPKSWPYFEGIDPHMSKPHGFVRVGITERRNLCIFHAERPVGTMEDLVEHIMSTRPNGESPVTDPLVDTAVNQFDNSVGKTQREQLMEAGLNVILANKRDNLLPGLREMNKMFYVGTRKKEGLKTNNAGLYVMDSCPKFIEEGKNYVWDDKKDDTPKGDDDLIDPARYVIIHDPLSISTTKVYDPRRESRNFGYGITRRKKTDRLKFSNEAFDKDLYEDDDNNQIRTIQRRVRY